MISHNPGLNMLLNLGWIIFSIQLYSPSVKSCVNYLLYTALFAVWNILQRRRNDNVCIGVKFDNNEMHEFLPNLKKNKHVTPITISYKIYNFRYQLKDRKFKRLSDKLSRRMSRITGLSTQLKPIQTDAENFQVKRLLMSFW